MSGSELAAQLARALCAAPEGPIGVAVSGGGDSIALLHLMQGWAEAEGRALAVATVDHGLRGESRDEALAVAEVAAGLGLSHDVLTWGHWQGSGNLQDAARTARRGLLAGWAREKGLVALALGHTLDDQAETFVARLARGSGVDGLSAMAPIRYEDGLAWLRPLLGVRRAALRVYLEARGLSWADDPSNEDVRFERIRIRKAMPALEALGLWPERLAATADIMDMARNALEEQAAGVARNVFRADPLGYIELYPQALGALAEETRLRLLAAALQWVSGAAYRPRLHALKGLLAAIVAPDFTGQTLHGVQLERRGEGVALCREPDKVGGSVAAGALWDERWQTDGPSDLEVHALGTKGLAMLPDWRALGHPRTALLAAPGFFRGGGLIAAPFALPAKECDAALVVAPDMFFLSFKTR